MNDNATTAAPAADPPRNTPPQTVCDALRRAAGRIRADDVLQAVADALHGGAEMEISLTIYQPADAEDVRVSVHLRERMPKRSILRFRNLPLPAA